MDEELKGLLGKAIRTELEGLSNLKSGSQEKSTAIDNVVRLYKLKIEETKNDLEYAEKEERRLMEKDQLREEVASHQQEETFKQNQLSEQVKDRYFRIGIAAAELIIPLIFYGAWMRKGFKFEETGTYTSGTFRNFFGRLKPTKK